MAARHEYAIVATKENAGSIPSAMPLKNSPHPLDGPGGKPGGPS